MRSGIVLLAAGSSSRLGQPKQLLLYKGCTLISRGIKTAQEAAPLALIVVIGAAGDLVSKEIKDKQIDVVYNPDFQEGIASSIRYGVRHVLDNYGEMENIILMACDQPYVTSAHIVKLIEAQQKINAKIVASFYADQLGVPALFNKILFKELIALKGDTGARTLIKKYAEDTMAVALPFGEIDVDTEAAYRDLISSTNDK